MTDAITLTNTERMELNRRASSRTDRAEDARRARLILLLADGHTWDEASERIECSRGFVASWSKRFAEQRIAGLYSRHIGQVATVLTPALEARILESTRRAPSASTHWTTRKLAAHLDVSHMMVARVWRKHGLKPHRIERYMASNDPDFEKKAADIIGLYLNPPAHAAVFCVDEKTQIQALNRKDPVLPLSPGRAERHGFEYFRHGTLSLYAAFNTKTGEVLGKTADRHTSAEFIAFLTDIVINQPRGKEIHVIADNFSAHKSQPVKDFLATHPKVHLHFTPTYSSWLNQVELWFGKIERDVIARGVFTSVSDLKRKLMKYIRHYNKAPRTVKWKYADPSRLSPLFSGGNMTDSFGARRKISVGRQEYEIHSLAALDRKLVGRLPFSLKILLENLLRFEDGVNVTRKDVEALINWDAKATPSQEISFTPSRVILQDFTGVPVVVDLAAMRDAMVALGGRAQEINPLAPLELVIDHSVQVDYFGGPDALQKNSEIEFARNRERYLFLRWGAQAFDNFKVVPPATGIVHQVNLEYLARVVMASDGWAYPDTLVGTDSHTTMINGLGVLGWGVGGIEAEAAMLGQPVSMLVPQVVGFKMSGKLPEGSTATDLVLRVTELLRKRNVVGKFVEFFGPGLATLPLADRATIANMAPEYGATCGIFPVDAATLDYLRFSGRDEKQVKLVEAYMKAQGLFHDATTPVAEYSDVLELDLAGVEPSMAGPKRPQDRLALGAVKQNFKDALASMVAGTNGPKPRPSSVERLVGEGGHAAVALVEPESEQVG